MTTLFGPAGFQPKKAAVTLPSNRSPNRQSLFLAAAIDAPPVTASALPRVCYSPFWNVGSRMIGAAGNPGTAGANPMTDPNAVPAGMTEVTPPTVNVSGAEVTVG
jgi:hypothetical protein